MGDHFEQGNAMTDFAFLKNSLLPVVWKPKTKNKLMKTGLKTRHKGAGPYHEENIFKPSGQPHQKQ